MTEELKRTTLQIDNSSSQNQMMTIIKKTDDKCWQGYGETGTHRHY